MSQFRVQSNTHFSSITMAQSRWSRGKPLSFLLVLLLQGLTEAQNLRRIPPERRHLNEENQTLIFDRDDPNSDEVGTYTNPPRVTIEPFTVMLRRTETALTGAQIETIRETMETVILNYIKNLRRRILLAKQEERSDIARNLEEPVIENVLLGRFDQKFNEAIAATIVSVNAGVVHYSAFPLPDADIVNGWAKDAIEQDLAAALKGVADLNSIDTVNFSFQQNQSNEQPPPSGGEPVENSSERAVDNGSDSSNTAIIAGSAAGGAALVAAAVIALLVVRRRRKQSVRIEDLGPVIENDLSSGQQQKENEPSRNKGNKLATVEERSLAESESEWTVATEAGDSTALKSIRPNQNSALRVGASANPSDVIFSESFERDRQVSLTKDMLTGQWSGRVSNSRGNGVMSESVLAPSHFVASQERQVRRAAAAANNSPGGETNSMSGSSSDDDSSGDDPVVFAQAHESNRARSPPPPRSNPRSRSGRGEFL